MITKIVIAFLLTIVIFNASAAEKCPRNGTNVEWDAECFEINGDSRQVKPAFIKQLHFNRYGVTTILITEPRELVAVNRQGAVVVPEIRHTGDFDYPSAEKGVGRFYALVRNQNGVLEKKCGYFKDKNFRIIVPAKFDACAPFKEGEAIACNECVSYCTGPDCQDSIMVGGRATILGSDGKIRDTSTLATLENLCDPPASLVRGPMSNGKTWIHCVEKIRKPLNNLPKEP